MTTLVFIESADGKIKKTSLEAVAYAHAMGDTVIAIAMGTIDKSALDAVGKYGATKVLHAADAKLDHPVIQVYASVIIQAMQQENADNLLLADSSLGTPVAAKVAVMTGVPAGKVAENGAVCPLASRATVPSGVPLEKNVTFPDGVPAVAGTGLT